MSVSRSQDVGQSLATVTPKGSPNLDRDRCDTPMSRRSQRSAQSFAHPRDGEPLVHSVPVLNNNKHQKTRQNLVQEEEPQREMQLQPPMRGMNPYATGNGNRYGVSNKYDKSLNWRKF